jgi:SecD/SecF fusion protein
MHDLLITRGVYARTGREVTTATVAALLTILGYSLYDTIIVFDRVRENIPRMPRAAFSQIVNRSMSEVLTRSLATTACTLMPILALLLFGGVPGSSELQDFAFALLIGVASGAYSSIFIASPVLTHWKEREPQYRARRQRLEAELGHVPAYAPTGADVEPTVKRRRRPGRLTQPEPETVSAAEFAQMKRDVEVEDRPVSRGTSTLTKRPQRTAPQRAKAKPDRASRPQDATPTRQEASEPDGAPAREPRPDGARTPEPEPKDSVSREPDASPAPEPEVASAREPDGAPAREPDVAPAPAPDIAENEGVAPVQKPKRPAKSRSRNRRHGRRR